jgi:nicotinate-nucleotide adenylyltransferase
MEIKRGAPSYTIDTVEQLMREHMHYPPHGRILAGGISIIIGSDSFESLPRWHDIFAISQLAKFAVASRSPVLNVSVDPNNNQTHSVYRLIKTTSIDIPTFDTSGTEVRERLKAGRSVKYLIPDVVEKYIRDNGLYLTSK